MFARRDDVRPLQRLQTDERLQSDIEALVSILDSLARSITEVGLLHPVVIRKDGVLIAGERRLAAAKQLGWSEIPVTFVDLEEIVRGEFAENAERKNFLPTEMEAIGRAMEPLEKAAAKERMSQGGKGWEVPTPSKTRDKVAAFAGVSARTLEKIREVCQAAEADPENFGHLPEEMDRTGKVNGAHRKLRMATIPRPIVNKIWPIPAIVPVVKSSVSAEAAHAVVAVPEVHPAKARHAAVLAEVAPAAEPVTKC